MKAILICPAVRPAVPQLAEAGPLVTAPILGECLVNHWIEHLAGLGAREITIIAPDRPEAVRTAIGDGARWGVHAEVVATRTEPSVEEAAQRYRPAGETGWLAAPNDIVLMNHLPKSELPLFDSYAAWYTALIAWIPQTITPVRIRVSEVRPGVWVGRRAHVSPEAQLIAPCWIGDQVLVGPRAVIGPGAILENRAVVEEEARVIESAVGPDTFVGPMTSVESSLASGNVLTNWRNDSSLHVPDPFLLCSLAHSSAPVTGGMFARAFGMLARAVGGPIVPRTNAAPDLKLPS